MGHSETIRTSDVERMLKLVAELADLPQDPLVRTRHALEGIARLIGADACFTTRLRTRPGTVDEFDPYALVTHGWSEGQVSAAAEIAQRDPFHLFVMEGLRQPEALRGACERAIGGLPYALVRTRLDAGRQRLRRPAQVEFRARVDADIDIAILAPGAEIGHHCSLGIARSTDQRRPFSRRQITLARLVWGNLQFLHHAPLAAVDERLWGARLPPRLTRVLESLLSGAGAKQVARHLNLSVHTVNEYIKEIYRRYGVSSRPELMALFSGPAPRAAVE